MPGVGAKGMPWREAMADAKKKNPQNVKEKAGQSPYKRMTAGGYKINRLNMDRSADSFPTTMLHRFNYGFPRMGRNFMEATESDPNFKPEK